MIVSTQGPQNIGQIMTHFNCGNLFLSPEEYQRENAWNISQKKLLIDTVFRGMDIPKFYLWRIDQSTLANGYPDGDTKKLYGKILERKRKDNEDPNPYVFEVVDGQQRIRTFLEFMNVQPQTENCYRGTWNGPFPSLEDTPMARGRKYENLNAEQKIKFSESILTVMVLENATISEIRDMFLRLQNGTPLNAQQKRDALGSNVGVVARELSELPFFNTSVNFDEEDGKHRMVASQILQLELKEKIVSCASRQLDKLYKQYIGIKFDDGVVSRAKKIIRVLGNVFPVKNQHLNQNYALSLYWLFSRILLTYEITIEQHGKIRDNFEKLDIARIEALARDYAGPNDEIFLDLSLAMSRGNTGTEGISTRHDIIGQFLFDQVALSPRPELDAQRSFTHEEKLILYHKAEGKCQIEHDGIACGRDIQFDDAVVDHVIPHSHGGKTVLGNGRIAYKLCNIARGNRNSFNPLSDCKKS